MEGVVNGASQIPSIAGGGIAPGSLISIHGVRFATPTTVVIRKSRRDFHLNVVNGGLHRIDAWVPYDVPVGTAALVLRSQGKESEPVSVTLERGALGLFAANQKGFGPGSAENVTPNGIR